MHAHSRLNCAMDLGNEDAFSDNVEEMGGFQQSEHGPVYLFTVTCIAESPPSGWKHLLTNGWRRIQS